MDEWQPASVALATPDAGRRTVVGGHFPSPQLPTRRPRLSLVQSVAEYGCTLNLPGSVITPTRFVADPAISRNPRPGCRHRQPPCRPGRSRCGPRSQKAIAASCNAFPASMVAAGSPAAWAGVAGANPDPLSGLWWAAFRLDTAQAAGVASWRWPGAPSPPLSSPRRQPTAPAAALLLGPKADRPRRTHDRPVPVCRTVRPPWPIAPGSECALSAVPECPQWSLAYSALPIPSQI